MRRIIAVTGMVLFSNSVALADGVEPIACPDSIQVAPQDLDNKIEGWHYFSDGNAKYTLVGLQVYSGKNDMVPFEAGRGTESYSQWLLSDNGKEKYYVVCRYSQTSVLLRRLLDSEIKSCKSFYEPDSKNPAAPQIFRKITCE